MQTLDSKTAHKIVSELVFVMKNGKLTPKFISNIMTKFVGGTDAGGAWDWRQAQDLMQAAALQLVCTGKFGKSASADDVLSQLMHFSGQLPTETRRSERQMMLQQFSTPLPYAWLAVAAVDLQKGDCVLEPSAGTGALARLAAQMGATVFANELDPLRQMLLSLYSKNTVTSHDAEFIDDLLDAKVQPSVILMNPPFSSSTARSADPSIALRHVISAAKRLQMGGRLVAIVPPCAHPHRSKALWDRLLAHVTPVLRITLPGTVYAKMGTSVETHLLIADKGDSATAYPEVRCGSLDEALHVIKERVPARLKLTRSFKATGASIASNVLKTAPKKPRQLLLVRGKSAQSTAPVSNLSLAPSIVSESRTNEAISAIYARYAPQRFALNQAQPHPTSLVESLAMGSVAPPLPSDTPLELPERLITSGALSEPQLETLVMAETSFAQDLPGRFVTDEEGRLQRDDADEAAVAYRQGYFLGDGTGCGKGRQVAGLILTGWLAGRKRAVWVSKSATLIEDARRDWIDLGGASTDIHALSKWKPDEDITLGNGILFVTYSTLRSVSRSGVRRLDQLLNWLGDDFDGILAFDEAHAMQNAAGSEGARGKAGPSQQGLAGLQVQMKLPRARALYVSATGATNVGNLAYATRLGLWGQGPEYAFTSRSAFVSAMEAGGVAAMEVVARDLKALGLYTARALSFDGVEYDIFEHQLTDSQIELYDTYAEAFQVIHQNLHNALEATGITSSAGGSEKGASASKSAAISAFESTKQRLFNHLLQGLKAPAVIDAMKRDLKDGWAPVVQIVSTGEALLKRRIETLDPGDELTEGMLTPREYVLGYLERGFPIAQQQLIEQEDGQVLAQPMLDGNGTPVISREAVALRDEAMEAILCLAPVPSALDQIIWSLGVDVVAEVTGRSQRPVKTEQLPTFVGRFTF